jgi:hypothetical protein
MISPLKEIYALYQHDHSLGDHFLKPQRWCHKQWSHLLEGDIKIIRLIFKIIFLSFLTPPAYTLGMIGIVVKGGSRCGTRIAEKIRRVFQGPLPPPPTSNPTSKKKSLNSPPPELPIYLFVKKFIETKLPPTTLNIAQVPGAANFERLYTKTSPFAHLIVKKNEPVSIEQRETRKSLGTFAKFPDTILWEICNHLGINSLIILRETCRHLRDLIDNTCPFQMEELCIYRLQGAQLQGVDETDRFYSKIPPIYRYHLYNLLCEELRASDREFILYLARRLGPFTFLCLPYASLEDELKGPMDYGHVDDQKKFYFFRFRIQDPSSKKTYTQVIVETPPCSMVTLATKDAFWPAGVKLSDENDCDLVAFLRKEKRQKRAFVGLPQDLKTRQDFIKLVLK